MKAVILAGGLGTRLKPFTQVIPKPLLPLGEKSILEIQISSLKRYGFDEIFLATNYKSDYIRSFFGDGSHLGVKLSVSKEEKPLGTCGPVKLLEDKLTEPFLVMNGDILTTIDFGKLYGFACNHKSRFTVVTKEILMPFQFGNVYHDETYITGIEEKPDIKLEIVAGIYIMKPEIFHDIPKNVYFGMDNLMKKLLENKAPIMRYLMNEYWIDIGQIDDYKEAQEMYENHFKDSDL